MKHTSWTTSKTPLLGLCLLMAALLGSCKEEDTTWDTYHDWESRNAAWFVQVKATAEASIQKAKEQYGDDWENHPDEYPWRTYKSLMRSPEVAGASCEYIVCKIRQKGTGTWSPTFSDSVRVHFRGWLMETAATPDDEAKGNTYANVFTETYSGTFNAETAAPQTMAVRGTVEGFQTALQYMVVGDEWDVYMPQELAYGKESSSVIPAYSTLLFRIHMVGAYKSGTGVPPWKQRGK